MKFGFEIAVVFLLTAVGAFLLGVGLTASTLRKAAVDKGVAYYDCIPETGDCAFTFGVPK